MWTLLFILCIAVNRRTKAADLVEVYAYERGNAKISCSYTGGYESYEKYLCTKNCGGADVLIKTTEGPKNRYSITDNRDKRIFTVTISNASSSDAGKYWCGVTRTGRDFYTEVKLHVQPDKCCKSVRTVQSYEDNNVSISCQYEPRFVNSFKYICKGSQPSTCREQALVTSDAKQNGQFTLSQAQNEFTVAITGVTKQNAGLYLCGVQTNVLDVFSQAELTVTEWCCVIPQDLKAFVGQSVTLKCPYPSQHVSNRKFLCKGPHRDSCQTVVTSGPRFRLQDDTASSLFSVTATELEAGDAGTYWCGSDSQWIPGNYTKIQLSVEYLNVTTVSPTSTMDITGSQATHNTEPVFFHTVLYVVAAVLPLLLIVGLVVLCKHTCFRAQASTVNESRSVKEESRSVKEEKISVKEEKISVKEEIAVDELYVNQEEMVLSKANISKKVDGCHGDQQEDLYENYGDQKNIYCNHY